MRTGTESQKWRSYGGLSVGVEGGEWRVKVQGISSINGRYKIGGVKNSKGKGEAKKLICMTPGHELRWGNVDGGGVQGRGV